MTRGWLWVLAPVAALAVIVPSRAAAPKVALEMWGLEAGDRVTLDGADLPVKGGATRIFLGDPTAANAPVLAEIAPGRHELAVLRDGCAPRTFSVDLQGQTKRSIVFEKADPAKCSIPTLPARR